MVSLNQILKKIKDLANSHILINTYEQGQKYDWSASQPILYPCLWAIPNGGSVAANPNQVVGNYVDYKVLLYAMDLENSDGSNQIEILSDTAQILLDIIAKLDNDLNDENLWTISSVGGIEPFVDAGTDTISGNSVEITFTTFYAKDNCSNIFS